QAGAMMASGGTSWAATVARLVSRATNIGTDRVARCVERRGYVACIWCRPPPSIVRGCEALASRHRAAADAVSRMVRILAPALSGTRFPATSTSRMASRRTARRSRAEPAKPAPAARTIDARDPRRWLLLVLVVGLAVRIAYLVFDRGDPFFEPVLLDAKYYHQWPQRILAGDVAGSGVFD